MNSGSVNKHAKGWFPPSWRCCRGMWAAREGMGLQGRCFDGQALHPFPSLSHSTALQNSFLSLTQWPRDRMRVNGGLLTSGVPYNTSVVAIWKHNPSC